MAICILDGEIVTFYGMTDISSRIDMVRHQTAWQSEN
jgi:hypothetical protein